MSRSTEIGRALCLSGLLLLSACGGGSSDSPPPVGNPPVVTPPGGGSPSGLVITSSKDALRFITLNGGGIAQDSITFSLAGAQANATYYAVAEPEDKSAFHTYIVDSSMTSITVGLNALKPASGAEGAIAFKLCHDERCANVAWSRSIPYRVRAYTIEQTPVELDTVEGARTTITRAIVPAAAPGDLTVESLDPWLSGAIDAAGQLAITVSGTANPKGNYSGYLTVAPPDRRGSNTGIRVGLTLGAGVVLPPDGALTLGNRSPLLVQQSMDLGFKGQQAPTWSVTSDKPWLVPVTTSGTGAASVSYAIDSSKLAALENFSADTGHLTFSIAGHPDASYKIVVDKKLAELQAVMPRQVRAGQWAQLRLRGRGLQQLDSAGAITLDGVALTSGAIVSDNEVSLTVSNLAAGAHVFDIPGGAPRAAQTVNAVQAPQLAAASIDSASVKNALLYSASRNAIYTLDQTNAKLLRYTLANGSWTLDRSTPAVSSARLGLSHDEKTLYTTSGGYTLEERDPDTLAIRASYVYKGYDPYLQDYRGAELPITNDGRIWFARDQWSDMLYFDTASKTFAVAEVPQNGSPHGPQYVVSADGSHLFVYSMTSTTYRALRYDLATGKFESVITPSFSSAGVALSGDGKYVLLNATEMYESDSARFVGQMPPDTGGYNKPALVSPDGRRIYAAATKYEFGVTSLTGIDVVDAASMTKLGTIALPNGVVDCTDDVYNCYLYGLLKLTPFGDAIIWTGNKKIAIIPIPAAMGSVSTARFKLVK